MTAAAPAIKFRRVWAMPNRWTFGVEPIRQFVARYHDARGVSVDPFAGKSCLATHSNDISPDSPAESRLDARQFLRGLVDRGITADLLIFDPPYSPRQLSECYREARTECGMAGTQNGKLYKECRDLFRQMARPGTIFLGFGWNSTGMGEGWALMEILLVCHGGAHNDTICIAEKCVQGVML